MFFKTGEVQIIATQRVEKIAQVVDPINNRKKQVGANLIDPELFKAVGSYYDLSSDPRDYCYITARAVSTDVPNNNGDAFPREELWRFTGTKNCFVYQTFINDPLQVNHVASNPKTARGFLLDSHYNMEDPTDEHVELVVAIDTRKDPALSLKLGTGEAKTFSMGCTAEMTQCSVCGNVAHSTNEFCDHIRHYRMQHVAGQLCYEKCYGVDFVELSYVPDPADVKAQTKEVLHSPVSKQSFASQPLINRLGLTPGQLKEVFAYFEYNVDKLPEGLVALGARLFK